MENDWLDRNHLEPHVPSQTLLKQVMTAQSLVVVWRVLHDKDRQFTWARSRENLLSAARLDRVYCFKHHVGIF